jgi:predicted dienelactone hydrolase
MKLASSVAVLIVLCLAVTARAKEAGPHKVVRLPQVDLVVMEGTRTLRLYITSAEVDRPMPVIIFSHGLGASGAAYTALLEHWASHGYVCIAPTHADSQTLLGRGARPDMRGWAERALDVRIVIDSLNPLQEMYPQLRDRIDVSRIGVAGHSFGAYTAQLIGGATIDIPGVEKGRSFADHRPAAVLLMSPQGTEQQGLTKQSWREFAKAMMVMTGSEDRGVRGQDAQWRLEPFTFAPEGDKYAVLIEGANHFSFSGRLARGENQQAIFDSIKAISLAFWDAHLKRDEEAKARLQSGEVATSDHVTVQFQHK